MPALISGPGATALPAYADPARLTRNKTLVIILICTLHDKQLAQTDQKKRV
jgi:hypothetical protein